MHVDPTCNHLITPTRHTLHLQRHMQLRLLRLLACARPAPPLSCAHHVLLLLCFNCVLVRAEKIVIKRQPGGPRSTGLINAPKVESLHALPFVQLYTGA